MVGYFVNVLTDDDVQALAGESPRISTKDNVYRDVFDLGTHVLKIDRPSDLRKGNCAAEVQIWERFGSLPSGKFLAPITAHGKLPDGRTWLVMVKAELEDVVPSDFLWLRLGDGYGYEKPSKAFIATWQPVLDFAQRVGIADVHYNNVGLIDGRPVIIDYAGPVLV